MTGPGTSLTSQDVRLESAKRANADIDQIAVANCDFMSTRPRLGLSLASAARRWHAKLGSATEAASWAASSHQLLLSFRFKDRRRDVASWQILLQKSPRSDCGIEIPNFRQFHADG
jgi:hypothetical protein